MIIKKTAQLGCFLYQITTQSYHRDDTAYQKHQDYTQTKRKEVIKIKLFLADFYQKCAIIAAQLSFVSYFMTQSKHDISTPTLSNLLDHSALGRIHWQLIFVCAFIIIFDGYDLFVYGVVLPVLMETWQLSPTIAGYLGSASLVGMMIGATGMGLLADRFGRKYVILVGLVLFSIATVLTGFMTEVVGFGVMRLLAGIGIGGVMPNVVALMNEYLPIKWRGLLTALVVSGFAFGGMVAASLGMVIVPKLGWQSMFFVAGIPLVLLPLLIKIFPESLYYLEAKGRQSTVQSILSKIAPDTHLTTAHPVTKPHTPNAKPKLIQGLFGDGRAFGTFMLWVAFFSCMLMIYGLTAWLPKLMANAGYGFHSSLAFLLLMNAGGIVGQLAGGYIADRRGFGKVIGIMFFFAMISIFILGFKLPSTILYMVVTVAGACTIGTMTILLTFAAQSYEAQVRATGVGIASSVGRIGAIIGPVLGGQLLAMSLPHAYNFWVFSLVGLLGAIAIL